MKHSRFLASTLAMLVGAGSTESSIAQGASASTRTEVKAETRRAAKEHQLVPAGEGTVPLAKGPKTRSALTRKQRKAETLAARKAGEILPAGDSSVLSGDRQTRSLASNKTRAQRKAETLEAAKAKKLLPAGEGSGAK